MVLLVSVESMALQLAVSIRENTIMKIKFSKQQKPYKVNKTVQGISSHSSKKDLL